MTKTFIALAALAALTAPALAEVSPRITNPAIVDNTGIDRTTTKSIDADKRYDAPARDAGRRLDDQSQEFGAHNH